MLSGIKDDTNEEIKVETDSEEPIGCFHTGISLNGGTQKWMIYEGHPIRMDDDWGTPIYGKPSYFIVHFSSNFTLLRFSNPKLSFGSNPWIPDSRGSFQVAGSL